MSERVYVSVDVLLEAAQEVRSSRGYTRGESISRQYDMALYYLKVNGSDGVVVQLAQEVMNLRKQLRTLDTQSHGRRSHSTLQRGQ